MLLYGQLSGRIPTAADGAMLKRLRVLGYSSQRIEDGLRGVHGMLAGTVTMPEEALSWCHGRFGMALLLNRTHGRRVVDLAADAWQKAQPPQTWITEGVL